MQNFDYIKRNYENLKNEIENLAQKLGVKIIDETEFKAMLEM